ncbi:hypothetical protein FOL47_004531 [Perkinsus chesapeaki]|uniref:Uncharacterized protein n=1 Tax=Perkinsus chesapeaki TaxID=330153 RepID=A0A7J6KKS2_PERCH|nr:hypothetical protein FOL47_004531 [Perkinsus chesapeaki]
MPEPQASTSHMTQANEGRNDGSFKTRPTVRSQFMEQMKSAHLDCDSMDIRSVKRIGIYNAEAAKHRPVMVNFGDTETANKFMKENTLALREAGLTFKWWRPPHMRRSRHGGPPMHNTQGYSAASRTEVATLKLQVENLTRMLTTNKENGVKVHEDIFRQRSVNQSCTGQDFQ